MVKRSGQSDIRHAAQTDAQNRHYRGGGMMGAVSIDLGLDDSGLMRVLLWGELFVRCSLNMAHD